MAVSRLRPGMRLARPVSSCAEGTRVPLLQRGATVTEGIREGLERAGIWAVYVEDDLSAGIDPEDVISPETRDAAVRALHDTFETVTASDRRARIPGEQIERLNGVVGSLLAEVRSSSGLAGSLMELNAFDSHTLTHSLNVCVIGLMIGDRVLRSPPPGVFRLPRPGDVDGRLQKLGLGLLLHDVGKLLIPADILQKPGPLTEDEMAIVREHPQNGIDLVERDALSPLARAAIIGHHERIDGRGYPFGKAGDEIHPHAQLAAIADVYDAVSSMRVYQQRRPTHEAWELVMSLAGTAFRLPLVQAFTRTVAPYPEGVAVMLSDGRRGLVARVTPDHISRPVVRVTHDARGARVTPHEMDLFEERSVTILDTLPDLEGPPGEPSAAAEPHAEAQEQRLAGVVG